MLRTTIDGEKIDIRYGVYPLRIREGRDNLFVGIYNAEILDKVGDYPCDTILSVNIDCEPEKVLGKDRTFFYNINHDNNLGKYLKFLLDNGYAEKTNVLCTSGFVDYPLVILTEKFYEEAEAV